MVVLREGDRLPASWIRHIFEPGAGFGVDHAERVDRRCTFVGRGEIEPAVSRIVPVLIATADLRDGGDNLTVKHIQDDRSATRHEQVMEWAKCLSAGTTVGWLVCIGHLNGPGIH